MSAKADSKEEYRLPVRFTEEERAAYAAWGMKKEKTIAPFATMMILIDVAVTVVTVLYLCGALGGFLAFSNMMRLWGGAVSSCTYTLVLVLTFLVTKPLDLLLDWLWGKPKPSKILSLFPQPQGVQYVLSQGKENLSTGLLTWEQWETAVLPLTNQIWIEGQCLTIGANTVKTIYPSGRQKPWMDHPDVKMAGILRLEEIQHTMEGYRASLEEQRREAEWRRANGVSASDS